jgi:transposase
MIQRQLKLKLSKAQESLLNEWLWQCAGVFNWAIRKIEQDTKDGIYYTQHGFQNLLVGHAKKIGMPSHTMQAMLLQAYVAWQRCFKKLAKKPRLKGARNKLNSIPFPDPIKAPINGKIRLSVIGELRFHKQDIPDGKIKNGRIIKRASGWYLAIVIDSSVNISRNFVPTGNEWIGVDPGFKDLLTLSDGTKIAAEKEYSAMEKRIGQSQRGYDKKLAARLQERVANRKKDRNHKLSRMLVEKCEVIAFSKDNTKGIRKRFGKSVANANHYQLRQMLTYKSSSCGRRYIEVDSRNSTRTCSACGCVTGPVGLRGLSVRQWTCIECGTQHDRDVNAAINTLIAAVGTTVEREARHA